MCRSDPFVFRAQCIAYQQLGLIRPQFVFPETRIQAAFSNPEQYLCLVQVYEKTHLIPRGIAMKQNIHNVERVVRVAVGLIVLSLVFVGPKSLWGLIGILPIITGLIGWCPPYQLLGISTCKK